MHPILFEISIPEFLQGILPATITVYSYGFLIMIGAIVAMTYTVIQNKKRYNISFDTSQTLFLIIFIGAFLGGKVFFFFENPSYYMENPSALWGSRGFVFYGSFIFSVTGILVFFKIKGLPILKMLDIIALTTGLVHVFGRMGCFMAGCCYGIPTESSYGVVFRDANSLARPLDTNLHPTQLYSVLLITLILATIVLLRRKQRFHGQLFLVYLMFYSVGRSIIEIFRGDLSRGFIIDNLLSHSQFISLLILIFSVFFYIKLGKKEPITTVKE
jgi:phosphatidylglycerol:prolipoprotein diacylglycerol transferase